MTFCRSLLDLRAVACLAMSGALVGCGEGPLPTPDPALVEAVVALHLLEARQARTGDVRPADRAAALARVGLDTAEVRAALARLREDPEAYAALFRAAALQVDSLAAIASGLVPPSAAPASDAGRPPPDSVPAKGLFSPAPRNAPPP